MKSEDLIYEEYSNQLKFEEMLEHSSKTLCVYFVNESPGLGYGVGKHLEHMTILFSDDDRYDFIVVELKSRQQDCCFSLLNGVPYYRLPFREGRNELYYKAAFYYFMSKFRNKENIILFFNYASQVDLAQNFRSIHGIKIVYIQHYMDWGIRFLGNVDLFKESLCNNPVAEAQFLKEIRIMEISDAVVVSSAHSIDTLVNLYHVSVSKIHLVPLSVDIVIPELEPIDVRLKYGVTESDRIILFVGRLDNNKGIEYLIKAFSSMTYNNLKLWIVGGGDIHKYLKLVDNNNWNKILFWGYRDRDFINEIYSITEIGIVPSYYEEFGYSALEMMSRGVPIIVRGTSGLMDLVENGKWGDVFVEDQLHINALATCMENRINNPYSIRERDALKIFANRKYSFEFFKLNMNKVLNHINF